VHTDGGELFFGNIAGRLNPDAGFAGNAISGNAEIGGGADHGFFEGADVPVDVAADAIEIENRVADDLAGAVIGDVATSIGFAEFDAFLAKDVLGSEKILLAGVSAKSDHVGVFAEEKHVIDGAGFARGDEAFLQGESGVPGVNSKIANEKRLRHVQRISDISEQETPESFPFRPAQRITILESFSFALFKRTFASCSLLSVSLISTPQFTR
jgi:hypothetical protein